MGIGIPSGAVAAIVAIMIFSPNIFSESIKGVIHIDDGPLNPNPQIAPRSEQQSEEQDGESQKPVNSNQYNNDNIQTLESWRNYALQKINEDRDDFGLQPVELSNNGAAQVHANDVLKTREISHWMTNGEKPYMTYSRLGGTGYVGQNVYVSGYDDPTYMQCKSFLIICDPVQPKRDIEHAEYVMMYEDAVCCDNGHRDNILDPFHTHVSLGIAYDGYFFVMVQNFENSYIDFTAPIVAARNEIQLRGELPQGMTMYSIVIEYDSLPTAQTYEQNKMRDSYDTGEIIAGVAQPGFYYDDIDTLEPAKWFESDSTVDIRFDLSELSKDRSGVYTIDVWLQDEEGTPILATNHAVFVT